jgi:hypothetical protein
MRKSSRSTRAPACCDASRDKLDSRYSSGNLLPPRRRAWPRGLEGAEEQGDDGRLPEKVPLVRELGDRLADVADTDINYLRRGGLGGGRVAGRRRSRLGDLQEHHGVEHAGGDGHNTIMSSIKFILPYYTNVPICGPWLHYQRPRSQLAEFYQFLR